MIRYFLKFFRKSLTSDRYARRWRPTVGASRSNQPGNY